MEKQTEMGARLHSSYVLSWGPVLSSVDINLFSIGKTKNRNKADMNLVEWKNTSFVIVFIAKMANDFLFM